MKLISYIINGLCLLLAILCGLYFIWHMTQRGMNCHDLLFVAINIFTIVMTSFNIKRTIDL